MHYIIIILLLINPYRYSIVVVHVKLIPGLQ